MKIQIILGQRYAGGGAGYSCQEQVQLEGIVSGCLVRQARIMGEVDVAIGTLRSRVRNTTTPIPGAEDVVFSTRVSIRGADNRPQAEGVLTFADGREIYLSEEVLPLCILHNHAIDTPYWPEAAMAAIDYTL